MEKSEVWKHFRKLTKGLGNQYFDVECSHCAGEALVENREAPIITNCRREKACNHLLECTAFSRFKSRDTQELRQPSQPLQPQPPSLNQSPPQASLSSTNKRRKRGPIDAFVDHELTPEQREEFHRRCLEMVATQRLPLNVFGSECFLRILDVIRPAAKKDAPSAKKLGGPLLTNEAAKAQAQALPVIQQRHQQGRCVGLLADGFTNISNQNVWGLIVQCGDAWFALDDGSGNLELSDEHHGLVTAQTLERALGAAESAVEAPVRALCVDQAGENERGQKILALRLPHIALLPCYCHFFHNFAKQVLVLPLLFVVFRDAAAIVTTIKRSSKRWKIRLDRENIRLYGRSPALVSLFKNRWNTAHAMAASMLQLQTSLSMFARPFRHEAKFPKVFDRLDDPGFWDLLKLGESVISGLSYASMVLQREDSCAADVVLTFGHIFMSATTAANPSFLAIVRGRWRKVGDQPMFLLAWILDPRFITTFIRARGLASDCFPPLFVADVVTYYYRKFFEDDASGVGLAVTEWLQQSWPEISTHGLTGIWDLLTHHHELPKQKLARLALHLRTLPVQSAGAERLFSDYGAQKTKVRNRLDPHRVHKLSAVRTRVLRSSRLHNAARSRRPRLPSPTELPMTVSGPQLRAAVLPRRDSASEAEDEDDALLLQEFYYANAVVPSGNTLANAVVVDGGDDTAPPPPEMSDDSDGDSAEDAGDAAIAGAGGDGFAWAVDTFGEPDAEDHGEAATRSDQQPVTWDVAEEVSRMRFSDGSQHRQRFPYPTFNDKNYPQEVVTGLRAMKFPLEAVFPVGLRLPSYAEASPFQTATAQDGVGTRPNGDATMTRDEEEGRSGRRCRGSSGCRPSNSGGRRSAMPAYEVEGQSGRGSSSSSAYRPSESRMWSSAMLRNEEERRYGLGSSSSSSYRPSK
eukprot:GHVU01052025.1.p1 GENE.GHVU01052025.1~~GHVU01052025.1.p1  ORF type:complete len:918 (+),score=97.15 GHVU01052025.1:302-3055(+)